jgi:hypothetical protein
VVKPGKPEVVLPLIPEFIRNEDGREKQDCERNVTKRWIKRHGERYSALKLTIVGDDRYCCHSICLELVEAGMSFLLTCKEESHPWIAKQVRYGELETLEVREWNGRVHLRHRYSWVNGIENRGEGENYWSIICNMKYTTSRRGSNIPEGTGDIWQEGRFLLGITLRNRPLLP